MLSWILSSWNWKSFAVGAGAVLFGGTVARPMVVQAVRTGLDLGDAVGGTVSKAIAEAQSIRADAEMLRGAAQPAVSDVMAEIQKLRADIAAMKSDAAGARAAKS